MPRKSSVPETPKAGKRIGSKKAPKDPARLVTKPEKTVLKIRRPNLLIATFTIEGVVPYVQNRFSGRKLRDLQRKMELGEVANKKRKREPRDFDRDYHEALHTSRDHWHGFPAPALRQAMISACRLEGFPMTKAKLTIFVLGDGVDEADGMPLVRITKGKPEKHMGRVRNETGVIDLRCRPLWAEGWQARPRIRFDADIFCLDDVGNLLMRAGLQVGIGEGRADGHKSAGVGWGHFALVGNVEVGA